MAFIQTSTKMTDVNVHRYGLGAEAKISLRLKGENASVCMSLAEAETLMTDLQAALVPVEQAAVA